MGVLALSCALAVAVRTATATEQANLPTSARQVVGKYVRRTGFEVLKFEFFENGTVEATSQYDHPGKSVNKGKWSFENGVVHLAMPDSKDDKEFKSKSDCTFLAWGDRLMMVDVDDLKDGFVASLFREEAERNKNLNLRGDHELTLTKVLAKVVSWDAKLPARYGQVVAPREYQAQFRAIEIERDRDDP